jgi:hypothetical protein
MCLILRCGSLISDGLLDQYGSLCVVGLLKYNGSLLSGGLLEQYGSLRRVGYLRADGSR